MFDITFTTLLAKNHKYVFEFVQVMYEILLVCFVGTRCMAPRIGLDVYFLFNVLTAVFMVFDLIFRTFILSTCVSNVKNNKHFLLAYRIQAKAETKADYQAETKAETEADNPA